MKDVPLSDDIFTPSRGAFLAHQLEEAAKVIVAQGDKLLRAAGLPFPSRAVSTVMLIGAQGPITAAEVAAILHQPHQLVTQRIQLLLDCGVIRRPSNPIDRRRKPVELTETGKKHIDTLMTILTEVDQVFADLSEELDCDLVSISQRLIEKLNRETLTDRVKSQKSAVE